ncbi:MAG: hypothetical protein FWE04_03750 [Oscillospiraceae bacterium]|nr:hypothetical protein [Oscillospiraceae bacterium]
MSNNTPTLESLMNKIGEIATAAEKQSSRIETMSDSLIKILQDQEQKINDVVEKQENKIKDLLPNAISAMGVFIAVVVVVFGGINLMSAFQSLRYVHIFTISWVSALVGIFVFNILFLLMFCISKLSGKPISNSCNKFRRKEAVKTTERHCINCSNEDISKDCAEHFKKPFRKYSYLYIINMMFIVLIGVLLWYGTTYDLFNIDYYNLFNAALH